MESFGITRVAVTIWEDRISPVFDASRNLIIAGIDGKKRICNESTLAFAPSRPSRLASTLRRMEVFILICGAISTEPAGCLQDGGITLIPFITGRWQAVLEAYASGRPLAPTFVMPGCREAAGETPGLKPARQDGKKAEGVA